MMILADLNRWAIVLYLRSWKEGKGVPHARRAVPCVTHHAHFRVENRVTCDLRRVCVREEITASLLLYRVNVLLFLRIESTQFFLFLYRLSANTSNPYTTIMLLIFTHNMICFMIFGIKICHKMPKNLTDSTTMHNRP
jgi:hypothetical protein